MNIRLMEQPQEVRVAVAFANAVYKRCVAQYSTVQEQRAFFEMNRFEYLMPAISGKEILLWGCFDKNTLAGILAVKNPGHIIMAYVWPEMQHRRIGSALLYEATNYCAQKIGITQLTVNAMPIPTMRFFQWNGFFRKPYIRIWRNIRYIPMIRRLPGNIVKEQKPVGMGWVALGMLGLSAVVGIFVLIFSII